MDFDFRLQGQVSKASKAYISNLAVTNHQRRRGIGRALLVRAEAMALQWECDEIYLHWYGPMQIHSAAGANNS